MPPLDPPGLNGSRETVVISSGFGRLHLALTAREASDRGLLRLAIMGAYPTAAVQRVTRFLRIADKGRVARLLEREEGIPRARLRPKLGAELVFEVTRVIQRLPVLRRIHAPLHRAILRAYGRAAARELRRLDGDLKIFHFLAAYGNHSIDEARARGMKVLCDHAIVHPMVIDPIIEQRGRLDLAIAAKATPRSTHWQEKLVDLAKSDAVIVNSDFVRDTFVAAGWDPDRVYVAQLGVDESFIRDLPTVSRTAGRGPLPMLYAGRFEPRKGLDVLAEALRDLDQPEWTLDVAGEVDPGMATKHAWLFESDRVRAHGTVLRTRLRELMLAAEVFVFPSYAEGSARVIFEALACGCYVITTRNSGSIVEDGVHGAIVEPGDVEGLKAAIAAAADDRERLAEIGNRNAGLVTGSYRQEHYGDRLAQIYGELAGSSG